MRRFAIIGHRAMSKGKLPLNDLAGSAGRMDVLVRALLSAFLTSHGIRNDVEMVLHLYGGPGPKRRLKFVGSELKGFHAQERAVAGLIAKVISKPNSPRGIWNQILPGVYDSGGDIEITLKEWRDSKLVVLDATKDMLWSDDSTIENGNQEYPDICFVLSDDLAMDNLDSENLLFRSLGETWLQGNSAITIVHFLMDQEVSLNL